MPFIGTATVVETKHWEAPNGLTVSIFSSHVPEGSKLVHTGYDIRWEDGTVGRGKEPFATMAEAQTFADKWNRERAARYAAVSHRHA